MWQAAKTIFGVVKATRLIIGQKLELKAEKLVAAGAVSLLKPLTIFESTTTSAMTLADGYQGQIKIVLMTVASGTMTITPSNFVDSTIAFDAVGEIWVGLFYRSQWHTIVATGATVA